MAIKSVQQGGNELRFTRTVSSDSDHDTPSGSGTSKGVGINHREIAGGSGAAEAQDSAEKQQTVGYARRNQIELEELRGDDLPDVGAVLLSQCVHSIFFSKKTTSALQDSPAPGVVILDFIPFPSKGGRASQQLLGKIRKRYSRCEYVFLSTLCGTVLVRVNVVCQPISHALYFFPRLHFLYFLIACHLSSWHSLTSSTRNCPKSTLSLSNERPKLAHAAYDSRSNLGS
jgi:hypothetical protein